MSSTNPPTPPPVPPAPPAPTPGEPNKRAVPVASPAPKPGMPTLRKLLIIAGGLLTVMVILVVLLPTILNLDPVKNLVVGMVDSRVSGSLQINSWSLGWGRGQTITGVVLRDMQGNEVLRASKIELKDLSIWSLLCGSRDIGVIHVQDPYLHLIQSFDGSTNLTQSIMTQRAIADATAQSPAKPAPTTLPANLRLKLVLDNGKIVYEPSRQEPAAIAFNTTLDIPRPSEIDIVCAAEILQGQEKGSINADVKIRNLFDAGGQLQADKANVQASANIHNAPVAIVDRFLRLRGRALAIIGPTIEMDVAVNGDLQNLQANLVARSSQADVKLALTSKNQVFEFSSDSKVELRVTPERLTKLLTPRRGFRRRDGAMEGGRFGSEPNSFDLFLSHTANLPQLRDPFTLTLLLNRLSLPVKKIEPDFSDVDLDMARLAVDLQLDVSPIHFTAKAAGVALGLSVTQLHALVQSSALGREAKFSFVANAAQTGQTTPGQIHLDLDAHDLLDAQGNPNFEKLTARLDGKIEQFPLLLADQLSRSGGTVVALVGPTLNMDLHSDIKAQAQGLFGSFQFLANAKELHADLQGQFTGNQFILAPNGGATLTLQPAAFNLIAKQKSLDRGIASSATLAEPAMLRLDIQRFILPLNVSPQQSMDSSRRHNRRQSNAQQQVMIQNVASTTAQVEEKTTAAPATPAASIKALVSVDRLIFDDVASLGRVTISPAAFSVDAPSIVGPIHAGLTAKIQSPQGASDLNLAVDARQAFDEQGNFTQNQCTASVQGGLEHLPLALVDSLGATGGKLVTLLGPELNIKITDTNIAPGPNGQPTVCFDVTAIAPQRLDMRLAGVYKSTLLSLSPSTHLDMLLTPASENTPGKFPGTIPATTPSAAPLKLAGPAKIHWQVTRFELPLNAYSDTSESAIAMLATIDKIALADLPGSEGLDVQLSDLKLQIPQVKLGDPIVARLDALFAHGSQTGKIHGQIVADHFNSSDKTQPRTITTDFNAQGLPVAFFDAIGQQNGMLTALLGAQIQNVKFKADTTLAVNDALTNFAAATTNFEVDVTSQNLKIDAAGQWVPRQQATLRDNSSLTLTVEPKALSLIMSRVAAKSKALAAGPATQENANAVAVAPLVTALTSDFQLAAPFTMQATAQHLIVKLREDANHDDMEESSGRPARTSRRKAANPQTVRDADATPIGDHVIDLPSFIDPATTQFTLTFSSTPVALVQVRDRSTLRLTDVKASAQSQDLTKTIALLANATFNVIPAPGSPGNSVSATAPSSGNFTSDTQITNLITSQGDIDYLRANYKLNTLVKNFPVATFDQLLRQEGQMVGSLGGNMNASVNGNFSPAGSGQLDILLDSENAKANIPALFNEGVLGLRQDASASIRVTPAFSKAFLQKFTGWVSAESSDKPIELRLLQKDFSVPVTQFDLNDVLVDATLDMGTMHLAANNPIIGVVYIVKDTLLGLLQKGGEQRIFGLVGGLMDTVTGKHPDAPGVIATFSTMNIHVQKSIVTYDNLTMTLDQLVTRFKGEVNLKTKANNLLMSIVGDSLASSSRGNVLRFMKGKDITIPIGGTYDNPKPNMKALTESLTKTLAGAGAGTGDAVGGVLQDLGGLLGGNKDRKNTPPPTNAQPSPTPAPAPGSTPAQNKPPTTQPKPKDRGIENLLNDVIGAVEDSKHKKKSKPTPAPGNTPGSTPATQPAPNNN